MTNLLVESVGGNHRIVQLSVEIVCPSRLLPTVQRSWWKLWWCSLEHNSVTVGLIQYTYLLKQLNYLVGPWANWMRTAAGTERWRRMEDAESCRDDGEAREWTGYLSSECMWHVHYSVSVSPWLTDRVCHVHVHWELVMSICGVSVCGTLSSSDYWLSSGDRLKEKGTDRLMEENQ